MKKSVIIATSILCLTAFNVSATGKTELDVNKPLEKVAPYPKAKTNTQRHVIYLPTLDNEQNSKVELVLGQELEVDCNRHLLSGKLEEKTLDGWGYDYYVVSDIKGPMATMMACPDNSKTKKFVTVNTGKELIRYNSRLPIVVYAPKDIQVKYRIWSAAAELSEAVEK